MSEPSKTGKVKTIEIAATKTDQENIGISSNESPVCRDVKTVVRSDTEAAITPTTPTPTPIKYRSTICAFPPLGPPLAMIDPITRPLPISHA